MKWNNERLNCANQTPTEEFHIWWLLGVDNGGTHSHRTIPEPLKFRAMMKPEDLNGLVRRSVFGSAPLFGVGPAGDIAESRDGYEPSYCCDTGVDLATLAALLGGKTKWKSITVTADWYFVEIFSGIALATYFLQGQIIALMRGRRRRKRSLNETSDVRTNRDQTSESFTNILKGLLTNHEQQIKMPDGWRTMCDRVVKDISKVLRTLFGGTQNIHKV